VIKKKGRDRDNQTVILKSSSESGSVSSLLLLKNSHLRHRMIKTSGLAAGRTPLFFAGPLVFSHHHFIIMTCSVVEEDLPPGMI